MQPLIGISMSREFEGDSPRDFVRATYTEAIVKAGGIPVLLPNVAASVELFKECQGLLLTGGGDVDPGCYGASDAGTEFDGVSADRDRIEWTLIAAANEREVPIFGICRGMQVLAAFFGGRLIQHLATSDGDSGIHHRQREPRHEVTHGVRVVSESRTARVLGVAQLKVNSFHHQAVDQVPAEWVVTATAPDGVIEAMEWAADRYMLGVQWHPEDLVDLEVPAQRLFDHFVAACRSDHKA